MTHTNPNPTPLFDEAYLKQQEEMGRLSDALDRELLTKPLPPAENPGAGECDVNHPPHYTAGNDIEVIDFIEDWEDELGFNGGNVVKYLCRAPYKGSELSDLKKAQFYLDRMVKKLEGEEGNEGKPTTNPPKPVGRV